MEKTLEQVESACMQRNKRLASREKEETVILRQFDRVSEQAV